MKRWICRYSTLATFPIVPSFWFIKSAKYSSLPLKCQKTPLDLKRTWILYIRAGLGGGRWWWTSCSIVYIAPRQLELHSPFELYTELAREEFNTVCNIKIVTASISIFENFGSRGVGTNKARIKHAYTCWAGFVRLDPVQGVPVWWRISGGGMILLQSFLCGTDGGRILITSMWKKIWNPVPIEENSFKFKNLHENVYLRLKCQ